MNRDKIIKAAHAGQHDAGYFEWFRDGVNELLNSSSDPDPVMAALSRAIKQDSDHEEVAITLEFYAKELQRAANAVKALDK